MMDICEAECRYDNSSIYMEECVHYRKYGNNENNYERKEAEFPDNTSPVDIEECLSDRKNDKNEK